MSYTLIHDEAVVVRDSDGVIVAPCQSVDDSGFRAYQAWVEAGNQPAVLATRASPQDTTAEE